MDTEADCACFDPQAGCQKFEETDLGCDEANGRYGEVTLWICSSCRRAWLRYLVQYEAFPRSGRWFRGLVAPEVVRSLTAGCALEILNGLPWYFCGGSYFGTSGRRATGPILVGP